MEKHIKVPMTREEAKQLKAGDYVYLTGTIYTARDAAHKRMQETLTAGKELPISIDGTIIYYMGPSPAREGRPIGSAGPTTASRMDKYAPQLLDLGLLGMIGKGRRSSAVKEAVVRNGAVYFAAVGGAGALLSKSIREAEVVAYEDLGTEAIRKLTVEEFPVIVCMDSEGTDLYETNYPDGGDQPVLRNCLLAEAVPYGSASRALYKRRALEASAVLGRAGMQGRENCIRSAWSGKAAGGTVYSVPEPSGNV